MTLGDAARDVASVATVWAGICLVLLLAACAGVARWARRSGRTDRPAALVFLALLSLAGILVLTLLRDGLPHGFVPGGLAWSSDGWQRLSSDPFGSTQILLNALLFLPAGVLWTVLTGRPWRVLGGLAALSVAIECLQGLTGIGAPDVADLVANTAGAALGSGAGTVWLWFRPGASGRERPTRRQLVRAGAVVATLGLVAVVGVTVGADRRQRSVEHELTAHFAGTDLGQFHQWEQEDRLTEEVFAAISVLSDGADYPDQSVVVRYPASFFGVRRCAFVEWRQADVEIRPGFGRDCSTLLTPGSSSLAAS